jgi:RHS repeat-associated protein
LPPYISITAPANGAVINYPSSFVITATASDSDGSVESIEFFVNNQSIGSGTASSKTYTPAAVGDYSIKAKATDDVGLTTMSSVITVHVLTPGNSPPTVSLTAPASATAPASLLLTATAADSDGIASVAFKSGTTVINTDTSPPYTYTYTGVPAGTYNFTAVATDSKGASTTSAVASVTVNASTNVAPTVSLTGPADGTSYAWGTPILMTATAADSDGSISKVQFLSNGAVVGEDATSPYSFSYLPGSGGSKSLTARAIDNNTSSTLSSAVAVTVASPPSVTETRSYVYDEYHRLCKTYNPESGATVIGYDAAGNIAWTADGLALPSKVSCDRDSTLITAANTTSRSYDKLNRVTAVHTPNGTADVLTDYDLDGAVMKLTASNPGGNTVVTDYEYNKRRLLTKETQTNNLDGNPNNLVKYYVTYGYTANAFLKTLRYPDGEVVNYAPDALGRPTQAVGTSASYASGVQYYPNGAMSTFQYGASTAGGPIHSMTQNGRQLPLRSQDIGATAVVLDDTYSYDENGNVTMIEDAAQAGAASQTRGMGYDGLDRLTAAVGPWGDAMYRYDALDNLRSADQGARQFRYNYTSTWRLDKIKDPAGTTLYAFGYDADGNVISKGSQTFTFDGANRMSTASTISGTAGLQSYRYDGMGRRVQTTDPGTTNPPSTYWFYDQAGQVLYSYEGRRLQNISYVYLNGSQIATRTKTNAGDVIVRYQMTDALGSPVASTDTTASASSILRTSYTPWGEVSPSVDGTGYTGHVMDGNTGLTYMQQRYFDGQSGRFLSIDPVSASPVNFNRYWYANNNPYHFKDPDGRESVGELIDSGAEGCGAVSCAGWAVLSAGWSVFGAEGVSQVLDKGGDAGAGNMAMAAVEVATLGQGGKVGAGIRAVTEVAQVARVARAEKVIARIATMGKEGSKGIREVTGSAGDAKKMFDTLRAGNKVTEVKPGVFTAEGAKGGTVTYRAESKSGPPTIDVNGIVDGIRKIKFLGE